MADLKFGTQVVYIPQHLGNLVKLLTVGVAGEKFIALVKKHSEFRTHVQFGFVQNMDSKVPGNVFCRYWQADLSELRTKANSELTPLQCLYEFQSVHPDQVTTAQNWIADETLRELGF